MPKGDADTVPEVIAVKVKFDRDIAILFDQAGLKSVYAVAKAIDEVGNKTKTQVVRATAKQAGVKVGKVRGVVVSRQAMGAGQGQYEMIARDATLSLKEFGPRRSAKGVSAAPWGTRKVFPHTFFGPNSHIFVRKGRARLPIKKLWGPAIPREFVKDEAERTFFLFSEKLLPDAVEKWLLRQVIK